MADYGFLMMHNPYSVTGDGDAAMLETFANSCATMLAARCEKTVTEVRELMEAETWLNAAAAKEHCFCDVVEASNDGHKEHMAAAVSVTDKLKAGALILNSILPQTIKKPKKQTMLNVTNALKLAAEANEDAIVQEITQLHNRVQKAEAAKAVLENKLELKEALVAGKDGEIARLKNELQLRLTETEKMRQDKAVAEAAAHLVRCEQMVKGYAAANKIRSEADTISRWVDKAVLDYDGTEVLLKDLGANASAPVLRMDGYTNGLQQKNAIGYQAEIMAKLKSRG